MAESRIPGRNQAASAAHQQLVARELNPHDLSGLSPRFHLTCDLAGLRVAEIAKSRRSDILVRGTLNRTGPARSHQGNTAETVRQPLDVPVPATLPGDFKSPLTCDD